MREERNHAQATPAPARADAAFRLLCEAGGALAAASDYESGLARLASLVTDSIADLCMVDVVMRDGVLVRVATHHRQAELTRLARELRRFPPDPGDGIDPFGRVVRTGEALLVPEVDSGWMQRHVEDAEHRELLRSLGVRSLIVAPLTARGRPLGMLTLASGDASRRFGADDLAVAEELGRRAALAVAYARLQRDAHTAGRAETEFLASMSHEFRTPAYVISMYADLLLMGVPEPIPASAQKHVEHIRVAANHLSELVTQVLTFSRLEADHEVVRRESADLVALARETAGLIEPLARQKHLGFATDLPETEVVALTDVNKLRQILFNLLGNAVKFTESGEVCLAVRVEDEHAVFEIRDTGIGISQEHRDKIFEPFWQAARESIPGSKGTGLGLGIVRSLVRLLEGEVAVESLPGQGSIFRVDLPLRHEDIRTTRRAAFTHE